MRRLFLGIDTSNYKTSVALTDGSEMIGMKSEFLDVPLGKRGLRQSEAFFMHSNRLPAYLAELLSGIRRTDIAAIGVSDKPRRAEGSYMPCFLAGLNTALEIGTALDIPVYRFSHQEGHAAAVFEDLTDTEPCIFMHLSGGTTEFLICSSDDQGYKMDIVGGTKDISVGQLLDRTGVAAGLPFPSGRYLDEAAFRVLNDRGTDFSKHVLPGLFPKIRLEEGRFNLSGAETRVLRYIEQNSSDPYTQELVFTEVMLNISNLLLEASKQLSAKYGIRRVVMAGGAASSKTLRMIAASCERDFDLRFGTPELSGDNATGTAKLAARSYFQEEQKKNETGNCITGK